MLPQFNNAELAKLYPTIVSEGFNMVLQSHHYRNALAFKELAELVEKSGNEHLKAWQTYFIGRGEFFAGNYKEAIQYLLAAEPGFEKFNDSLGIAYGNKRLGIIYRYNLNDYKQALKYYQRALAFMKDSSGINSILTEIFWCYNGLGETDSSIYYLNRVKNFSYQNGRHYVDLTLYDQLNMMLNAVPGSEDSVKKYYSLFLSNEIRYQNFAALIFAHYTYGQTLMQLNRYAEAEQLLKNGLKYTVMCPECIKEHRDLYSSLFALYDTLGNTFEALKYLKLTNEYEKKFNVKDVSNQLKNGEENFRFKQEQQTLKLEQEKTSIQLNAERKQKYFFIAGLIVVLLFAGVFFFQRNKISKEKKRSDSLNEELKGTLQNLKSAQQQLVHSEKMASIGNAKFVQGIYFIAVVILRFQNSLKRINKIGLLPDYHVVREQKKYK
jgi:tetratricopeptide (TPR) repeat protein